MRHSKPEISRAQKKHPDNPGPYTADTPETKAMPHFTGSMNQRFLTILDDFSSEKSPSPKAIRHARARWLSISNRTEHLIPLHARTLLDPLLLTGSIIDHIERTGESATIDLQLNNTASTAHSEEQWGGPIRILLDGLRTIEVSGGILQAISTSDRIIWSELRLQQSETNLLTIVLQFTSGLRLRATAQDIRFATLGLPC